MHKTRHADASSALPLRLALATALLVLAAIVAALGDWRQAGAQEPAPVLKVDLVVPPT
jgi:hypothetical protein